MRSLALKRILSQHLQRPYRCFSSNSSKTTVIQLLQSLGSQKEVDQYLKMYSQVDSFKFAVIKVGGGVLLDELDALADSLSFLHKVGLYPIVVHGAGPQLNDELKAEGLVSDYIGGMRITSPQILRTAQRVFQRENLKLVHALESRGTKARPIISGVFQAQRKDPKFGLVGEIDNVNTAQIDSSIRNGYLPILTCLGSDEFGQALNINADVAARELSKAVQPVKVIYISQKGGLLDEHHKLITNIDILDDFDALMGQEWLKHGDRLKLNQIKAILDILPPTSSVAVTSAKLLAEELFTHKGSGTLIRNHERIHSFDASNMNQLDMDRLKVLVETSFDGQLVPQYFSTVMKDIEKVYVSGLYRAAAIITKPAFCPENWVYLEKFAVLHQFRSLGLGQRIWKQMVKEFPQILWRSRVSNTINPWYFGQANGSVKFNDWVVFWNGSLDLKNASQVLSGVLDAPVTLNRRSGVNPLFSSGGKLRVGLLGARGYTGEEVIRIIERHPKMDLTVASSRKHKGKRVSDVFSHTNSQIVFESLGPKEFEQFDHSKVDQWIFALPNKHASEYIDAVPSNVGVIDLSADFRFDSDWVYGLPENPKYRSQLLNATRISNPGCYATGAQLGLLPLIGQVLDESQIPSVFGVSGYSGAGTTPCDKNDPTNLSNNIIPYALVDHIHEHEISRHCVRAHFAPHVGQWFRGISLTVSGSLSSRASVDDLKHLFECFYKQSDLVQIVDRVPSVRSIDGRSHAEIGGFHVSNDLEKFAHVVVLDNLLKGAASQCIQNLNISHGFNELEGVWE